MTTRWEFMLPVRTVSGDNQREHWAKRSQRVRSQRAATHWQMLKLAHFAPMNRWHARYWPAWRITLTRIAPRPLDEHDGLPSSCKAIVDEIVSQLGLPNDRDPRLSFEYRQERGAPKTYAVRVRIEKRELSHPSVDAGA